MTQKRGWTPVTLDRAPVGAYSPAVRAGDFLFLSGQVPVDLASGAVIGEDVAAQTHAVLDRIERLLGEAGSSLADVVSVTAYLADIDDWDSFNEAYKSRFEQPFPARTTVGAGLHGFLVEISVTAFLGRRE